MFTAPATCHLLFVYKRNKNLQSENTCWFSRPVLNPGVLLTKQSCPQTTPWLGCRKHPLAVSIPLFLFCWVRIPQKVNPDERIWNWKAKLESNTKKRKKKGGGGSVSTAAMCWMCWTLQTWNTAQVPSWVNGCPWQLTNSQLFSSPQKSSQCLRWDCFMVYENCPPWLEVITNMNLEECKRQWHHLP